ncbi:hypothetical protein Back11_58650 [Paenibacillus baekrokdamisoli]|uniref:Uncharacterized protein n=1 Tax=Paenibacillus baekrokdamisoli TaxID=1712516 RepID=A0A3G9J021_9BACL|nr:hypothetical protein [Paenibacillus baekrokdamisoli]MBB3071449.1 hypothetical protein [Paenibacillus baekrokdamisoli]BBH24520.1 hypothetical protein Back11_58650 [Paenibacillus baekrokdamisoli]
MTEAGNSPTGTNNDLKHEGRENYFLDIDRMVNEGLGGGQVTLHNGLVAESTTDTMEMKQEQELEQEQEQELESGE